MASFGLNIEDKAWIKFGPDGTEAQAAECAQPVPEACDAQPKNTPFQKTLAYCSYFTLLFTTISVFRPWQVANAANVIGGLVGFEQVAPLKAGPPKLPAPEQHELIIAKWQLRPLSHSDYPDFLDAGKF